MTHRPFKTKHKLLCSAIVALVATPLCATAEVTAPVGFVELTLSAEADTPFSIPMNRAKEFAGVASAAVATNTVTIANNDLTAGAFDEGLQHKTHYLLFTSGTLTGRSFDIVSNTVNTITVAPTIIAEGLPEDLEDTVNDSAARDTFEIRPHWTLGTLFPNGENIPKTTSFVNIQSAVLFRPIVDNTNTPTDRQYIYFDSTNDAADGWYIPGNTGAGKQNDVVLGNQTFYIFRNNSQQDSKSKIVGDVPTVDFTNSLRTSLISIDNYKAISFPVEMTLSESNLVESGMFKQTTSFTLRDGDTLLTYTYPATGINQPTSGEYVYFNSSNDAADGWYIPGNTAAGKQDAQTIFKPGRAYIIRTANRNAIDKQHWKTPLPYSPFAE